MTPGHSSTTYFLLPTIVQSRRDREGGTQHTRETKGEFAELGTQGRNEGEVRRKQKEEGKGRELRIYSTQPIIVL